MRAAPLPPALALAARALAAHHSTAISWQRPGRLRARSRSLGLNVCPGGAGGAPADGHVPPSGAGSGVRSRCRGVEGRPGWDDPSGGAAAVGLMAQEEGPGAEGLSPTGSGDTRRARASRS